MLPKMVMAPLEAIKQAPGQQACPAYAFCSRRLQAPLKAALELLHTLCQRQAFCTRGRVTPESCSAARCARAELLRWMYR